MKPDSKTPSLTAATRFHTPPNDWIPRVIGALALLVVGGVHYQLYRYESYSVLPTIGWLFLANFVSATVIGLVMLVPLRLLPGRMGGLLQPLAALAGIGVTVGSVVALLISEHVPLFGFREYGYRFVVVLALGSEATALAMLSLYLVRTLRGRRAVASATAGQHDRRPSGPLHRPPATSA